MRAATIPAARRLDVGDVAVRDPQPDEAVVAVSACGVCGSNLHEWRHPDQGITSEVLPGAAGHELAGQVVVAAGDGSGPPPGTRVVVEPNRVRGCGRCAACTTGSAWFCPAPRLVAGWGFAERMVVPTAALFPVPEGVGDDVATLAEPLACGVHALRGTHRYATTGLEDVTVAVVGAGVTGLLAATAARHLGAATVVVLARHPHQARAATLLGADAVLLSGDDDARDRLRRLRPHVVVEAVGGAADTLRLSLGVVAPRGEVAVLGLFDEAQPLPVRRATFRELRLSFPITYGVQDGIHDLAIALDVLATGGTVYDHLITHRFGLDDVAAAFSTADDKAAGSLRVVVHP